MTTQRSASLRNPAYIGVQPFRQLLARWIEIEDTRFASKPGEVHPETRIGEILWPEHTQKDRDRRLFALMREQDNIHFDLADAVICKVLGKPELWITEPDLAEIYQSVNLLAVDAQEPTCEAATEETKAIIIDAYTRTGSRWKASQEIGVNAGRIGRIVEEARAVAV